MANQNFILGLSVGIGKTLTEAEYAMRQGAKKRRGSDPLNVSIDTKDYNIAQFADLPSCEQKVGRNLESEIESQRPLYEGLIVDYRAVKAFLDQHNPSMAGIYEKSQTIDHTTGLLNRLGYYLAEKRVASQLSVEGYSTFYIFFDCDHMKYWNDQPNIGFAETTKRVCAVGRGIYHEIRHHANQPPGGKPRRHLDKIPQRVELFDIVAATRVHGTTGDEFLVKLFCPEQEIIRITRRLIKAAYDEQLKLNQ